jgi:hypothetical protein
LKTNAFCSIEVTFWEKNYALRDNKGSFLDERFIEVTF